MNAVPFPPVDFPDPEIHPAKRDFPIVLEPNGRVVDGYLRHNSHDHEFAYERYDKVIDLGAKGKILYGRIHQRASPSSSRYQETEDYVVIKKLSLAYIRNRGGTENVSENPRVEIAAAQAIGDDVHVVGMYEVLEDKKYLYLIMPYFGTDLFDAVQAATNSTMETDDGEAPAADNSPNAPLLLTTLCHNLLYLQGHNIIHRDFSPENVIVHSVHAEECCPLIDLAMALQCASLEEQALSIIPQETACGKLPYMSPEVAQCEALDFGVDVYALGCTLFFIWSGGKMLYEHPGDRCFNFFVRNNGILSAPQVDMDMWLNLAELPMDWHPILEKLPAVQNLTDEQRDLLAHMLHFEPAERLTVPEVLQHAYLEQAAEMQHQHQP